MGENAPNFVSMARKYYGGIKYYPQKKSKYNANKSQICGITFASQKEAKRYLWLLAEQQAGNIANLELQKRYVLLEDIREPDTVGKKGGVHKGKVIERGIDYVADFVYEKDGETVVEDVKGYKDGGAYRVFVIKRKLMLNKYGIRIKEV